MSLNVYTYIIYGYIFKIQYNNCSGKYGINNNNNNNNRSKQSHLFE